MVALYGFLSFAFLAGAVALVLIDRKRNPPSNQAREEWAFAHGFTYIGTDPSLETQWERAALAMGDVPMTDVVLGKYYDEYAYIFDLGKDTTIIAIQSDHATSVFVDIRMEEELAPVEEDLILLGSLGPRVMSATDVTAVRELWDRRLVALASHAPPYVRVLWNEGKWVLGAVSATQDSDQLDVALDTVRRFGDLLRCLPVRWISQVDS